ncbi:MAG: hypothetical protein AAGJ46_02455 [Planctomycetota bacterium]
MKNTPSHTNRHAFHRSDRKSGVALVCVIVCLSIATTMAAASTSAILKQRRSLKKERQLRQVELLLDAGLQRASAQLLADRGYTGELWRLDTEVLQCMGAAAVQIRIDREPSSPVASVTIVASLPADSDTPVRRSSTYYLTGNGATDDVYAPSPTLDP